MKIILYVFLASLLSSASVAQSKLNEWKKGILDIHFISTGKGNAAFYIFPDGTNLLVDMGALASTDSSRRARQVPDDSKSPAQWVADYIYQFNPDGKKAELDYALITHYHDDHMGSFGNESPNHVLGNYKLSGITELGSIIPIKKIIDRGYDYPIDMRELMKNNPNDRMLELFNHYWNFINYQKKTNALQYEKLKVGSSTQFRLKKAPQDYQHFVIKNLFANGEIADISDSTVSMRKFKVGENPGENNLSCGIRISYGKFDFYTGGDIPGIGHTGALDNISMESYTAPVIGPVDVATLNHHGNRDSQNEFYIRTIQPRVWIGQSWTANHPGEEVLRRITSQFVYPGERDLFTNFLHESNINVLGKNGRESYKSTSGHIVVRVYPNGDNYDVFVLDDKSAERNITAHYSYKSR